MSSEMIDLTVEDSASTDAVPLVLVPNQYCDLTLDSSTDDEDCPTCSNVSVSIPNNEFVANDLVSLDYDVGDGEKSSLGYNAQNNIHALPVDFFEDVYCSNAEEEDDDIIHNEDMVVSGSTSYSQNLSKSTLLDDSCSKQSGKNVTSEEMEDCTKKVKRPVGRPRKVNQNTSAIITNEEKKVKTSKVKRMSVKRSYLQNKVLRSTFSDTKERRSSQKQIDSLKREMTSVNKKNQLAKLPINRTSTFSSSSSYDKYNPMDTRKRTLGGKTSRSVGAKMSKSFDNSKNSKVMKIKNNQTENFIPPTRGRPRKMSPSDMQDQRKVFSNNEDSEKKRKRSLENLESFSAKKPRFEGSKNNSEGFKVDGSQEKNVTTRSPGCPRKIQSPPTDKLRPGNAIKRYCKKNKKSFVAEKSCRSVIVKSKSHRIPKDKSDFSSIKSSPSKPKIKQSVRISTKSKGETIVDLTEKSSHSEKRNKHVTNISNKKFRDNISKGEKKWKQNKLKALSKKMSNIKRKYAKKLTEESKKIKLNELKDKKKSVQKVKIKNSEVKPKRIQNVKVKKRKYVKRKLKCDNSGNKQDILPEDVMLFSGVFTENDEVSPRRVTQKGKLDMRFRLNKHIAEASKKSGRKKQSLYKLSHDTAECFKQGLKSYRLGENESTASTSRIEEIVARGYPLFLNRERETSFPLYKEQSQWESNKNLTTDSDDEVDGCQKLYPDPNAGNPMLEVDMDAAEGNEDYINLADKAILNHSQVLEKSNQSCQSRTKFFRGCIPHSKENNLFLDGDRNSYESKFEISPDNFVSTNSARKRIRDEFLYFDSYDEHVVKYPSSDHPLRSVNVNTYQNDECCDNEDFNHIARKVPIIPPNPSKEPVSIFYYTPKQIVICNESHRCCKKFAVNRVDKSVQCDMNEQTFNSHSITGLEYKESTLKAKENNVPSSLSKNATDKQAVHAQTQHISQPSSVSLKSCTSEDRQSIKDTQYQVRVQMNPNFPEIYTVRRKNPKTLPKFENNKPFPRSSQSNFKQFQHQSFTDINLSSSTSSSSNSKRRFVEPLYSNRTTSGNELVWGRSEDLVSLNCLPMEISSSVYTNDTIETVIENNPSPSVNLVNSNSASSTCDNSCLEKESVDQTTLENHSNSSVNLANSNGASSRSVDICADSEMIDHDDVECEFVSSDELKTLLPSSNGANVEKVLQDAGYPNSRVFETNTVLSTEGAALCGMTHESQGSEPLYNSLTYASSSLSIENVMEYADDNVQENRKNVVDSDSNKSVSSATIVTVDETDDVSSKTFESNMKEVCGTRDSVFKNVSRVTENVNNVENETENNTNNDSYTNESENIQTITFDGETKNSEIVSNNATKNIEVVTKAVDKDSDNFDNLMDSVDNVSDKADNDISLIGTVNKGSDDFDRLMEIAHIIPKIVTVTEPVHQDRKNFGTALENTANVSAHVTKMDEIMMETIDKDSDNFDIVMKNVNNISDDVPKNVDAVTKAVGKDIDYFDNDLENVGNMSDIIAKNVDTMTEIGDKDSDYFDNEMENIGNISDIIPKNVDTLTEPGDKGSNDVYSAIENETDCLPFG